MLTMLMIRAAMAQDVDTVDFKETEKAIEEAVVKCFQFSCNDNIK